MSISARERFLGICRFERPGDLYIRDSFWPTTLEEWVKQGAPKQMAVPTMEGQIRGIPFLYDYFHFDPRPHWLTEVISGLAGVTAHRPPELDSRIVLFWAQYTPLVPYYEPRIISEDERTLTFTSGDRQTLRVFKDNPLKMPMFLDWPVKDRATWNELKKRLDPNTPERWPSDWKAYVQGMNRVGEDVPISLEVGGFYGYLREWIGSERILYMFYDDPVLIEDMMEQMLYLEIEVIKRVVKDIRVDMATFWEDMCYKAGPLISPAMVRRFMMPRYKKITDLLRSNGVDVIYLDSDGNIEQLVPLWLESGINYLWPFEVAAGNDAVALRKKYGKDLIIGGTIDKRALAKGKEAIKEEVMSKVPFLLGQGGYLPTTDHGVPPDVTFENYCYYINLMREVAGLDKISF